MYHFDNLETTVKELSIQELMAYYKPEEIHGYCRECPNYNQYWSCPPHNRSIPNYLGQFKWVYIIGTKVYLNTLPATVDPIEYYHMKKEMLNLWLIDKEQNTTVLISGHCHICETCSRKTGEACSVSLKQRFSLESLGFKLTDIIENCFNDKLQWKKSETPEYLYIITGLLTSTKVNTEILLSYPDK